ncbi:MAG: geranylgeranylglycerol-phosphate geranylgeranyltransferase [Sphingobacteriia bacterium]|nr:geranylgeranylglycerol-phosphate geranylgeranyltransferase [Sphingobacteriia bacterium]
MKILAAFFRLIRWPNLVFIALTQVLFFYAIVQSSLHPWQSTLFSNKYIALLTLAYILIAAGGNIINDYFDLNIDIINKPDKLVVEKFISRRWVIILHFVTSLSGILIGGYLSKQMGQWLIFLSCIVSVLLLFLYSASLKKKFLIGNILVSALTAWVILLITLLEFAPFKQMPEHIAMYRRIMRLGIVYTSFAFIISLIREVIKDMEDVEGDRRYGCTTMPIVWGINATKVFLAVWLVVLTASLILLQLYSLTFGWWLSIAYSLFFLILPLIWILKKLQKAQSKKDFHSLSNMVKLVMFAGILSMLFFKLYA